MVRILFRGQVFEHELTELAARRGWDFIVARDEAELLRRLPEAEALWITPTMYTPAVPKAIAKERGKLRWLGLTSAGYDVLLTAGAPADVLVTYATGVYGPAVAEHALALLLGLIRQLPLALERQRSATWDRAIAGRLRALEDMTVAVVGFGAIGREIAKRLRPFAKAIIGVTRSGSPDPLADEMAPVSRLHQVLARSDVVVLSVAMNEATRHLIDAAAFDAMRAGTILINVARGPIVDPEALRRAIASGTISAAGLDVTDPEPLPGTDALWQLPETIVTPHVGGFGSIAAGRRLAEHFERNADRLAAGEALEGLIPATR